MTLSEFHAWLDGLGHAIGDAPTPEQWALIKDRLAEVEPFRVAPAPSYPNRGIMPCVGPYTSTTIAQPPTMWGAA